MIFPHIILAAFTCLNIIYILKDKVYNKDKILILDCLHGKVYFLNNIILSIRRYDQMMRQSICSL